jgi:hypothetical protein
MNSLQMKKCDGQNITRRGVRCCAAAQVPDKALCGKKCRENITYELRSCEPIDVIDGMDSDD